MAANAYGDSLLGRATRKAWTFILLGLMSRFGGKLLGTGVFFPQNGTAVLEGLSGPLLP